MKMFGEKFSPAQLLILFAALLCLLPPDTAQAAPGSCNARYEVVVTQVNGMPMNQVIQFGAFQSQGRGRGQLDANISAKQNAEQCMQSHWNGRMNGTAPYQCTDQRRISGYTVQNVESTLQQEVCQSLGPRACDRGQSNIQYSIFAVVDGGPGCGTRMSPAARTLLASGAITQCECRGGHRPDRRPMPAPQQVSPTQSTVFYHIPRRTLLTWQPVERAESYLVEIKYNGGVWNTLSAAGDATFVSFDFPGPGQGEWRVIPQSRRGREGTPSPWSGFSYQR